ncbi:outer membrane protein assembly factor BamB family protein [Catalinimonas niigatensis]|uniref:outer membrane protein assembly factor BamB family protein n=1 Tax=Catalinimonas niigatensis TaxID=1397264 RepID=UPI0026665F1D|nr:PQQ-binding-like beta-propeller repeat protein [Catalinimonas niigatensis]WPP49345.1 PQQ-binding-like beta-propeller repeat protein [Catalinimonas niigatensis]
MTLCDSSLPKLALFFLLYLTACQSEKQHEDPVADENWPVYRGTKAANQFSSLDQINTSNVSTLVPAWTYHTGDADERSTIQCNPLVIDGVMYITSPKLAVLALNAQNGEEIWKYEPESENTIAGVNRGVTYWSDGQEERIIFTAGYDMMALNASDGKVIQSFGKEGKVDLREGLIYPVEKLSLSSTSPGIMYQDLIIMGSSTGEGYNASPGFVRAYDVRTGERVWTFHTIPQEGEAGYDTWDWEEKGWYGGVNVWNGFSLDEERGWVFLATGSPSYDFYGANRKGENLYGNSVIAVEAATGKYVWHYQVVHHDLLDYDLPCAPSLVTITLDDQEVEAVVQPTKMGYLVVLDRETGKPLFEMEEQPVPASDIPGEEAWPTQPYPKTGFYTRQNLTKDDLRTFSTGTNEDPEEEYAKYRYEGRFTPPSIEGSLAMPSTLGGGLWGGASVDPRTQTLYINANEMASINKVRPVTVHEEVGVMDDQTDAEPDVALGQTLYELNCSACHGVDRKGIPPAFPSLMEVGDRHATDKIAGIIRNGNGAMPAFSQFSDRELSSMVMFLEQGEDVIQSTRLSSTENKGQRYVIAGYGKFLDKKGYPFTAPPWGSLNAIDLHTGELKWRVPLGEVEELTQQGIPITGTRNFGGCISTSGGLVFVAASTDEKIRAFDAESGEELWEAELPAGGYAVPATYMVDGRQYVVIAAGGGGRGGTPTADAYVAFALPEE